MIARLGEKDVAGGVNHYAPRRIQHRIARLPAIACETHIAATAARDGSDNSLRLDENRAKNINTNEINRRNAGPHGNPTRIFDSKP